MSEVAYHPKAQLTKVRNTKAGLTSRTKIISSMEGGAETIAEIADRSRLSYGCVSHHLRLLKREKITVRSGGRRRYTWTLTEFGQQKLQT
jgi:DNA-binding IclR family transcriptional regulator